MSKKKSYGTFFIRFKALKPPHNILRWEAHSKEEAKQLRRLVK
jgi:hypothetical protein